jgi:hypothetical protein
MKNLGYTSKNILITMLLILASAIVDFATGHPFFTIGAGGIAVMPFIDLKKPATNCNMAGISTKVYVIDVDDIASFPAVNPVIGAPATYVSFVGDFVLKAGKKWKEFYSTKEMGELMSEIDGPAGGPFFRNKATIFYPSTSADALGSMFLLKGADVIVILKEFSGGGQMRVVGDLDIPATMKGSENTGKGFGDEKGITFTIEAASCRPALVYSGAVVTSETPATYTETNETSTPAQFVDGYDGITGWNTDAYPKLYFDVYSNVGVLTLRAYTTEANRDLATSPVFSVAANTNTVIEANASGFGGTLTVATGIIAGDEFYVTVT